MRIGEVSRIVGISTSAIRFYERHGLINTASITRAENGYRVYEQQDVDEIRLILRFKEFGIDLKEIQRLLSEESKSCGDLVSSIDLQLVKCRQLEKLIKDRIASLLAAKSSCESSCNPDKQLRKCRAQSAEL